jgi:hypothetical protein
MTKYIPIEWIYIHEIMMSEWLGRVVKHKSGKVDVYMTSHDKSSLDGLNKGIIEICGEQMFPSTFRKRLGRKEYNLHIVESIEKLVKEDEPF